jgi:hypothetical protein
MTNFYIGSTNPPYVEDQCENNINPAYVLTQANPDIPQDVLTHVLRYFQKSPQEIMAFEHKKVVCSNILGTIRKMLKKRVRHSPSEEDPEQLDFVAHESPILPRIKNLEYALSDVTRLFLEHLKKKIKIMRNNDTKLEVVISLLHPGKIRSEMNRFNKNSIQGMYSLTYSFISKKLKQNTHLVSKY